MNDNRVLLGQLLANNKDKINGYLLASIVFECNNDIDLFDDYRVYEKDVINDVLLYGLDALDIMNLVIKSTNINTDDDLFMFTEDSIESLSTEEYHDWLIDDFDIIVDAISESESSFSLDLYENILTLLKDKVSIESE